MREDSKVVASRLYQNGNWLISVVIDCFQLYIKNSWSHQNLYLFNWK